MEARVRADEARSLLLLARDAQARGMLALCRLYAQASINASREARGMPRKTFARPDPPPARNA